MKIKTNLERAHEKARLLLVRSVDESSTENERNAAANALARLCKRYGLNASKLRKEPDAGSILRGGEILVNKSGRHCSWASALANACAKLYGGDTISLTNRGFISYSKIAFVGTGQQIESSNALYHFLKKEMNRQCKKAMQNNSNGVNTRSFGSSFRVSFAMAIHSRVSDINETRKAREDELESQGVKLYDRGVVEYMNNLNLKIKVTTMRVTNRDGANRGQAAGDAVNLGNTISPLALT